MHEDMDVIGHDHEVAGPDAGAVKMRQRPGYKSVRGIQYAASVALVEFHEKLPLLFALESGALF